MPQAADELMNSHDPEYEAYESLALELTTGTAMPFALALYRRLDEAGRRILIETTRDAIERRL